MINLVSRGFGTAPQSKRTIGIYLSKISCEFDFDIHHRLESCDKYDQYNKENTNYSNGGFYSLTLRKNNKEKTAFSTFEYAFAILCSL